MVRRIVTIDDGGRSRVLDDGEARGAAGFAELWPAAAGDEPWRLEPPPGEVSWRVFDLPPDEVVARYLADQGHAGGDAGWHRTETIDFVMILDGEVALALDDEEVELGPGDCVVQQGTNHAWRNRSGRAVRMAVVMLSTRRP